MATTRSPLKEIAHITFRTFPTSTSRKAVRAASFQGTKGIVFDDGSVWCENFRVNVCNTIKTIPPDVFRLLGCLKMLSIVEAKELEERANNLHDLRAEAWKAEEIIGDMEELGIKPTKAQKKKLNAVIAGYRRVSRLQGRKQP